MIFAIDPGPRTSGYVAYEDNGPDRYVVAAVKDADIDQVRKAMAYYASLCSDEDPFVVVCERTQAGPPSTQVVLTTEVVGRIIEMAHVLGVRCHRYYRRQVLQALGCARKGNKDSLVRVACIEMHGGSKAVAVGTSKNEGPLYGVTSHAWQALGLACAHIIMTAQHERTHGHDND